MIKINNILIAQKKMKLLYITLKVSNKDNNYSNITKLY